MGKNSPVVQGVNCNSGDLDSILCFVIDFLCDIGQVI